MVGWALKVPLLSNLSRSLRSTRCAGCLFLQQFIMFVSLMVILSAIALAWTIYPMLICFLLLVVRLIYSSATRASPMTKPFPTYASEIMVFAFFRGKSATIHS